MKKVISLSLTVILGSLCFDAEATRTFNFNALKVMTDAGNIPSNVAAQVIKIPGVETQVPAATINKAASIGAGNYLTDKWTDYKGFASDVKVFVHLLSRVNGTSADSSKKTGDLLANNFNAGAAEAGAVSRTFSWETIGALTLNQAGALNSLNLNEALARMYAFDWTSGKVDAGVTDVTNVHRLYCMGVCLAVMNDFGLIDSNAHAADLTADTGSIGNVAGNIHAFFTNYNPSADETKATDAQKLKASQTLELIASTLQ